MPNTPKYDSGFFATVKAQRGETTPGVDFNFVRAFVVGACADPQFGLTLREARVGEVVTIVDPTQAKAAMATPGRGADVAIVDMRTGGAGKAAAESLRAQAAVPMLMLVDGLGIDAMDLAFKLKPATLVPPPHTPAALNSYLTQVARRPA